MNRARKSQKAKIKYVASRRCRDERRRGDAHEHNN